ncbi:hypothetical protein SAMN02799630_04154 [Paenibacillus sp. UNCCL117]|nr:hypothetical protein SAMN04488602_11498 [Paenibacillus sp. cl123]SFW54408.1 hypothetical protein SAMN02799630_04154 [Paenibacillus sp. UNCCL117]
MNLTPDQVLTICKGDQEIAAFVQTLLNTIEKQAERIEQLESRVHATWDRECCFTKRPYSRFFGVPTFHLTTIKPNGTCGWSR